MGSFHGANKRRRYFEGWYFKLQAEGGAVALIPAMHITAAGQKSASLQIITGGASARIDYPYEKFHAGRNGLRVTLGDSLFSAEGVRVRAEAEGLRVRGEVRFGPLTPLRYDIMGPFRYLPMQCFHSVFSIRHALSGSLLVNGVPLRFDGGTGYIEGDRGSSFPVRYAWTQCCEDGACVMLSVADIPLMGRTFSGVAGFVYLGGRELRLATYLGARPGRIEKDLLSVRQGGYLLQAELLCADRQPLSAAVEGGMTRVIHESLSARVRYRLYENGRAKLDFVSRRAGFEYEY